VGQDHLSTALTRSNVALGTPDYVAPEQLEIGGEVDKRADIFSLGVTIYELFTGIVPRGIFDLPSEKVASLDPRLDTVVAKAMQSEPVHRYQSVRDMLNDIEHIAKTNPPEESKKHGRKTASFRMRVIDTDGDNNSHSTTIDLTRRPRPRKRGPLIAAAIGAVALAAVGIAWLLGGRDEPRGGEIAPFLSMPVPKTAGEGWSAPINLGSDLNSPGFEGAPSISSDGLVLLMSADREGGPGGADIWMATRESIEDEFGEPAPFDDAVNTEFAEVNPCLSADGLALYFSSSRDRGESGPKVYVSTREDTTLPFGPAQALGDAVNSESLDGAPSITADGLELYFHSDRPGGGGSRDLWVSRRSPVDESFSEAENLGPNVNSSTRDHDPAITADGLSLYFSSGRGGDSQDQDIWVTRRSSRDEPFQPALKLEAPVNTKYLETAPTLSPDGWTLVFESDRPGGEGANDIWFSERPSLTADN
jgi:Tol biopolymer transport system component